MLTIQVISPSRSANIVRSVIKISFPDLRAEYFEYDDYTDAPAIVKKLDEQAKIILFTGFAPYQLSKDLINRDSLAIYIADCSTFLIKALLEARENQIDISVLSMDTYSRNCLDLIYLEIGKQKVPKVYPVDYAHFDTDNHKILNDHMYNYHVNKVTCCMTQVYSVYEKLKQQGIPAVHIAPTRAKIEELLHNSIVEYGRKNNSATDIVALRVRIDSYSEHSIHYGNEYSQTLNRGIIAKNMYLFAKQLNGALIECGLDEFWVLTTDADLSNGTSNLTTFNFILDMPHTVSIGIGYGDNIVSCKQSASVAMLKSIGQGGNKIYMARGADFIQPILASDLLDRGNPKENIDNVMMDISEKTGVSTKLLFKLISTIEREKRMTFTSTELALLSGVNIRTVNRMLDKLERSGYCKISSKRYMTDNGGRPSRVFSFNMQGLLSSEQ